MVDWVSNLGTQVFIHHVLYSFKPTPFLHIFLCGHFISWVWPHVIYPMPVVFLLYRSIDEMKRLEEVSHMFQSSGVERHPPEPKSQTEGNEDSETREQPWEMVMEKKHFKLWRRPITGTPLYQYRGEPSLAALCALWLPRCAGLLFLILFKLFCSGGFSENMSCSTVCCFSSPRWQESQCLRCWTLL